MSDLPGNMSERERRIRAKASWLAVPETGPYLSTGRFDRPKETFKCVLRHLKRLAQPDRQYRLIDLGCANGEFLYLVKKEFPHWQLSGIDVTPAYIETARNSGRLDGVDLRAGDLFDATGTYDFVTLIGTFPLLEELEAPLDKMLSLCAPGGWIFADSYFNKHEVECLRLVFRDDSVASTRGLWRMSYAQYPRARVREFLKDKTNEVLFEDVELPEIPRDSSASQIRVWTFKNAEGRNIATNGTNLILDVAMLIAQKATPG